MMTVLSILSLIFSIVSSGKICSFLALEGIGYPVDTCMFQSEHDAGGDYQFAFEFVCDDNKVSSIYWESSTHCSGHSDLEMDDYYCAEEAKLSGQECKCKGRGKACDTFTIEMNETESCAEEQDQSTSIVVNECIPTGYGQSQLFQCDEYVLTMETWTNDNCEGVGEYAEFDYSYLNDNYCFNIQCLYGSRRIKKCNQRGRHAEKEGIDVITKHIQNHHLFVHNIITKHRSLNSIHSINNVDIFSHHGIWLPVVIIIIACIAIFALCKYRYNNSNRYQKI